MPFPFDEKQGSRGPSPSRSTRNENRRHLLNDLLNQFDDQYNSMFGGDHHSKKGFPFDDDDDDIGFGGLAERLLGRKRTAPPHAPVPAPAPPSRNNSNSPQPSPFMNQDPSCRRQPQSNLPQHGLRNTVDIGAAAAAAGMSGVSDFGERGQRSWSAPPPDHRHSTPENMQTNRQGHPQRFVSKLNIPMNTSQIPTEYSTEKPKSQELPSHQQHQQSQQSSNSGNVRHIPIFVEGRDEPVYSKDKQNNMSSAKPPRPQQTKQHHPPPPPPPPQQQQQQQQPPPPPPQPSQQQIPKQETSPPPSPVNPIQQKLEYIMDELNRLAREIKALPWPSNRSDKAYIYIDEMLTRCLIQLDSLESGGDDNLRLARRELVRRTQCCITELEARLEPPPPDMTPVLVGPIAQPQVQLKRPKKTEEPMEINQAVMLGPVAEPQPQVQRRQNAKCTTDNDQKQLPEYMESQPSEQINIDGGKQLEPAVLVGPVQPPQKVPTKMKS